ncbi:MAG TPA: cytochrome c3 family protein [Verrucomicrobiae bacterium]|nr:cytochrome c3 family protein [Verrucomicrobiae bacterium]
MKSFPKFFLGLPLLVAFTAGAESVINTVHNLSVNGPGTIKATTEENACIFCHTVHRANGETPLWNHSMSSETNYTVYSSQHLTDLHVVVPQPNGSSRLCLSCHDGTVALGDVSSCTTPIAMQGGVTTMPQGENNLGTDLASDHPISFVYDSTLASLDSDEIKDPSQLTGPVKLDNEHRLQCTSCHDPHDDQYGDFLVMDNSGSALCLACHQPNSWTGSAHAISSTIVPQSIIAQISGGTKIRPGATPRVAAGATMAAVGCEACHVSHNAGGGKYLMQSAVAEQNCFVCHNGTAVQKNVQADFEKISVHPITLNSDTHSPDEDPINPPERHVTCADCHNPHAANKTVAVAPNVSGALAGVTGVTAAGGIIKPAQKEYEVCFRCHADSVERGEATVTRQFPQTNTRLQFASGNESFHPVEVAGKNTTSVPSLISPWTVNSVIYCTDCHNSDTSPAAGGNGANGPHGSAFRPILERNLVFEDFQAESPAAYALCYKCHSRSVILSNTSFRFHELHVVEQKTACTTCHDSHGVANEPHLINFNLTYVSTNSLGQLNYISTGAFSGACSLTCHGKEHDNTAY